MPWHLIPGDRLQVHRSRPADVGVEIEHWGGHASSYASAAGLGLVREAIRRPRCRRRTLEDPREHRATKRGFATVCNGCARFSDARVMETEPTMGRTNDDFDDVALEALAEAYAAPASSVPRRRSPS
ncbi:MAG: hypothetical protein IT293_01300 [Deltaproteobacteria bacterium]|nr:hypothetical protein [Deltaproteobacteria bacterium]